MKHCIRHCDSELKSPQHHQFAASGSTLVFLYFYAGKVVAGSVGDSRATLGTLWENIQPLPLEMDNAYCRRVDARPIKAIRLTIDQKPHHLGEKERIEAAGGRVSRLEDDDGGKLGPYRVMSIYGLAPGLAMSRSLGDKLGEDVGVISEPVIHTFPLYFDRDKFVVVGSDGLWDVMTNEEVACFVDSRLQEKREDQKSVAQLLCEEARYRWMGIVEKEEVVVDDISCIVIKLPHHPSSIDCDFDFVDDRELAHPVSLQSTIALT